MKIFYVAVTALMLFCCVPSYAEDSKVKETDWISQTQLGVVFSQSNDNRFMLFKVVGKRSDDDTISYKGFLKPYPANLDRFYSYWGMSTAHYQTRKTALENAGYAEIWHQSFLDAGGQEVHQAVWQKLIKAGIEKKKNDNRSPQNIEAHLATGTHSNA